MFRNFDELFESIKKASSMKRAVVVVAEDEHTLEAVIDARKNKIIEPVLVGNKEKIIEILEKLKVNEDIIIYEAEDVNQAAEIGVKLIHDNMGDFLMKGKIETGQLLKAVVNKETGLGTGEVMSHISIQTVPNYHKLLATTDGGMLLYPTLEQKKSIIENAVKIFNALGYDKPKVGVLAAVEKVNEKMPETIEAAKLKEMNKNGEIQNCIVEGPISFDLSISKEKAEIKEYTSQVAGDADVLVVPNITAGNILGKSLVEIAGAKMAGLVVGAKVPIIVTSRGSTSEEKYLSILLAASVSEYRE